MNNSVLTENSFAVIDKDFQAHLKELEKGHVEIMHRVNRFSGNGNGLEKRLAEEIEAYEPWRVSIMDKLADISAMFDEKQAMDHRNYIRTTRYYRIVQEAPFYWRIINKPNGYAGDAEMMRYIYRNRFEGNSPFGKFLHKHAVETKACQSVRNRKTYLVDQLRSMEKGKILSLAAGPAQEIREILKDHGKNGYQFLALDHDLETLQRFKHPQKPSQFTYALANAFQIIAGKHYAAKPRQFFERYCYPRKDFRGLRRLYCSLKYELIDLKGERFDLVYSAGLYDYIQTFQLDDSKGTVALTKNLFDLVKSGGSLIVGNFNHNNPKDLRFVMEYIYDWQLIYRHKYEMMDFARAINQQEIKSIQIFEEPLGINYFLKIEKN